MIKKLFIILVLTLLALLFISEKIDIFTKIREEILIKVGVIKNDSELSGNNTKK